MSNIKIDAFRPVGIGGTKGIDVSKLKLFVGGLPADLTSNDLHDLFSSFGTIREAVVIPDRFRVRSRCYGFVTFANTESVSAAFRAGPFWRNGCKLTVILASTNSKPRRAHFNVRHGSSGHKELAPMHENAVSYAKAVQVVQPPKGSKISMVQLACREAAHISKPKTANSKDNKTKSVGTYTDPSLFRTANIQSIAPAVFDIAVKPKAKPAAAMYNAWPNEDIQNDFNQMHKMRLSGSSSRAYKAPRTSWKEIVMQKQGAVHTSKGCDESCSSSSYSRSHKWRPVVNDTGAGSDSQSVRRNRCTPSVEESDDSKTATATVSEADNQEIEVAMMELLKSEFEYRMNRSLQSADVSQQSPVVFNQNRNGTWSPYQTAFTLATSINIDGSNANNSGVCFSIPMEYNSQ